MCLKFIQELYKLFNCICRKLQLKKAFNSPKPSFYLYHQMFVVYFRFPSKCFFASNLLQKNTSETGVTFVKSAINVSFHPRKIITLQKKDMVYLCSFKTGFYSQS